MDSPATLAVIVVFFLALLGAGVSIAYVVGRKGGIASVPPHDDRKLPDRYVRELEELLKLSNQALIDSDALTAILTNQTPTVNEPVSSAVGQLIKTTKDITERANKIGAEAKISIPKPGQQTTDERESPFVEPGAAAADGSAPAADTGDSQVSAECLNQEEVDESKDGELAPSPFDDARKFKRSSFRGAVKATIYPRQPGPGREPVQCMVLTRDLSCGGIGIAHTEQLFPKQIVVLDAVGKLLVGEVRWCRREDENFYVAGCRLVKTNG
jgi:hypothetical protein